MYKSRRPGGAAASPVMVLIVCLAAQLLVPVADAQDAKPETPRQRLTLEDLYSDYNVIDVSISPAGKTIAATIRTQEKDALVLLDLASGKKIAITHFNKDAFGKQIDVHIGFVMWKTEERLLFQLRSDVDENLKISQLSESSIYKLGNRLYAVNSDGKNLVPMFGDQWQEELVGAFDTSDVASMLWNDPGHILMRVGGWDGRSLFKVDVNTGRGKVVEKQKEGVVDWWFDVNGAAVVRVEYSLGTLRYYRKLDDGKWKKYHTMRRQELEEQSEFELIGPSTDPNKFYVLARPPGKDRIGVYLYDVPNEAYGEPLFENPTYDIATARAAPDGNGILYHCYDANVRVCDFADSKRNAYMRGLRKFFDESANVYIVESSKDENTILLRVDGPNVPPAFYYYLVDKKSIEFVGLQQGALRDKLMPASAVIQYKTRDGQQQTGYLSYPPGAKDAKGLPLVLLVHGGPQARDRLEFDPWVQYLTARGYAVFQPNFRGSGGFGLAYEASGYRERGGKMQDDLTDGVKWLADQGIIDPARVCIAGMSYGGYAALAGAAFTPDVYKCAVSIAGVSNYEEHVRFKKKKYGSDSETYEYYVRAVGDPDKDQAAIRAISPAFHVDAIKIPILLIHGDKDELVDYSQSESMQKLLEKAGRKSQLIRLKDEDHGGFARNSSKVLWSAVGTFLWENLGKGFGVDSPPMKYTFVK